MSDFRSEMIANAAIVVPTAKDPVLPTKILPWKFRKASDNQTINGTNNRIAFEPEMANRPIIIIAGQIVSKPFNPPSWFTVFVVMVTMSGMIMK